MKELRRVGKRFGERFQFFCRMGQIFDAILEFVPKRGTAMAMERLDNLSDKRAQ